MDECMYDKKDLSRMEHAQSLEELKNQPDESRKLTFRAWVKEREHPVARFIYAAAKRLRALHIPVVTPFHRTLFYAFVALQSAWNSLWRIFWYTPLFQGRLLRPAPNLYVFGGMPLVLGTLDIEVGRESRISGQTTFSGRSASRDRPRLSIGSNVEIGWQTTIAVGRRVHIGDNVLIAGKCFLAGYPGHPLDPVLRASGQPDSEDQVGDIILEDNVWLATGVTVLAGVRIGRGSIVTAGSVVFRDIPAGFIATGNPAKAIMPIPILTSANAL
jgi:acetyltransferase-like isoleucine patch superfamily enzyme